MTTIAAGASATIVVASGGQVAISSNGGQWMVTETPAIGTARTSSHGPIAQTRVFGPYIGGASLTIANQSVNAFNYVDYEVLSPINSTIAVGATQTFTLADQASVSAANTSGFWSLTVTPAIGSSTTTVYGPGAGSTTFGPYPGGATVVLQNISGSNIVCTASTPGDHLTFVSNRTFIPNSTITIASGKEFETTEIAFKAPPYATNSFVLAFPSFYASSGAQVEKATSQIAITSAYMRIAGVLYPITFSGSTAGTVPAGGYLLGNCTATIPANATFTVVTSRQNIIGDTIPAYFYGQSALGDRQNQGSTSQEGGIVPNTLTAAAYSSRCYGPLCITGMGWAAAGRPPVPLIAGDSRAWGVAQNNVFETPTGVLGFVATGLDDNSTSTRYSYGNFAVPGTNLTNFSATSGQFALRGQLLADLGYPFTCIINEMGFNSGFGSSATWQGLHVTGTNYLKTLGGRPIINLSMFDSSTLSDSTTVWSDSATQVAATDQMAAINTYLAGKPNGASGYIDLSNVFLDGTGKWNIPAYASTLSAGVSSGQSISLAAKPADGACLVIEPGNANFEFVRVRSSTGSGPYTATLTAASVISKTHISGVTVKETNTADGTHPEQPITITGAAPIIAAKNSGVFL